MWQRVSMGMVGAVLLAVLVAEALQARSPQGPKGGSGLRFEEQRTDTPRTSRFPERPASQRHHEIGSVIPLERPDDPYLAPRRQRAVSPARLVVRGSFVSVQVNVNVQGENMVGDAANEPSIAVDPTDLDKIVIGWRQFDDVASNFRQAGWAYSHDGGQTWTFPGVLEEQVFRSDPVLGSDGDGNFYYYSLTVLPEFPNYDEYRVDLFKSTDGGLTWLDPVDGFGGDKQWMVIDRTTSMGRGNIYGNWNVQFTCCSPDSDFSRSVDGGASFESPLAIPEPKMKWGTLDVAPDGTLYLAGAALDTTQGHVIARSSNAKNAVETPLFDLAGAFDLGGTTAAGGVNPGGLLGPVWIATDHSSGPLRGSVYVLASVDVPGADPLDIMFTRSTDGGHTWSPPLRVNDDPVGSLGWQWFGTMSVAPNGRIDAIWNDTRNDPGNFLSELFYSFSLDGGFTWSPNVPVSPSFDPSLGYPQQDKLGDYYHMVSDDDGANVAYAATFNGEQDVYFVRINPEQVPLPTRLDHFMSYRVKRDGEGSEFFRFGPIRLSDEFGSRKYHVLKPSQLLLPANKNDEGLFDGVTHLGEYRIKASEDTPQFSVVKDIRVLNQCNDLLLEVRAPTSLLVPTNKNLSGPVDAPDTADHVVDHFLCYRVKLQSRSADGTRLPRFPRGIQVSVADQFQTRRYDLKKITKLCTPVGKDEDPSMPPTILAGPDEGIPFPIQPAVIRNPDRNLVCYRARLASRRISQDGCGCDTTVDPRCRGVSVFPGQVKHVRRIGINTNNQLGPALLDTIKEVELCVPSLTSR